MLLADGHSSSFLGRSKMTIGLGDRELAHTITMTCPHYGCQLVLKDGFYELQFGNPSEAIYGQPVTHTCFWVSVENTAVVPPRSEALVAGKIVSQYTPVRGVLKPMARLMEVNQLILARSLVDTSSDIIPLLVFNPTVYPCTLYKDTVAVMCEPVDLVEAPHIRENNVALCQKHEKADSLTDAVDNDGEMLSIP